jgi:FkbM family methyltransferase
MAGDADESKLKAYPDRIKSIFMHLTHGTLPNRLVEEWHAYLSRRRSAWWEKQTGRRRTSFVFNLQSGIKMRLYPDSKLCREIYCNDFEANQRHFFNHYLRPGDCVVDIGANIGLFTLIAASRVGEHGRVYAIEPALTTYRRLLENIALNRLTHVTSRQLAVSDHSGQIGLNVSQDGYDAWNSIVQPTMGSAFTVEMVRALRWDDFADEHCLLGRITLMKIDVEGWETHVLSGGLETFSSPDAPVLQIEFTDMASQSAGTSCQALYHQLEGLGYQMFLYQSQSKRIIPDPIRDRYPYCNLIAAKDPEVVNNRLNGTSQ